MEPDRRMSNNDDDYECGYASLDRLFTVLVIGVVAVFGLYIVGQL